VITVGFGHDNPMIHPMNINPIPSVERAAWDTLGSLRVLPKELFSQVIDTLEGTALVTALFTNRQWFTLTSDSILWKKIFDREGLAYFDETKCRTYRGEPGYVPPLSWPRVYGFYNSPCTLEPGKLRKETHKLQLFYKEIDGIAISMNHAGELAKIPKPGSRGIAACFDKDLENLALKVFQEEKLGDPFWGFVALKLLGYDEVLKSLATKRAEAKQYPLYRISRAVERAVANFDNVVEGRGFIDGPDSIAICEGRVVGDFGYGEKEHGVVMGETVEDGLYVSWYEAHGDFASNGFSGVALLLKC
jgi:hypothetical protein